MSDMNICLICLFINSSNFSSLPTKHKQYIVGTQSSPGQSGEAPPKWTTAEPEVRQEEKRKEQGLEGLQKPRSRKRHGTMKDLRSGQHDWSVWWEGKREVCLGREVGGSSWRVFWTRLRNRNFSLRQSREIESFWTHRGDMIQFEF